MRPLAGTKRQLIGVAIPIAKELKMGNLNTARQAKADKHLARLIRTTQYGITTLTIDGEGMSEIVAAHVTKDQSPAEERKSWEPTESTSSPQPD